jgi:hypothetical protein
MLSLSIVNFACRNSVYSPNSASNSVLPDWDLQVSLAVPSPWLNEVKNRGKASRVNKYFMVIYNIAAKIRTLRKPV